MTIIFIFIAAAILCCLIFIILMLYKQPIKLGQQELDLSEVMPIQYIDNNYIVNGNGDITIGYKIFFPEVFSLSEEDALMIHSKIEGLLKLLPAGTTFHQQNFYYTIPHKSKEYSTNFLYASNLNNYNGREILQSYSNIYITFSNNTFKKSATRTSLLRRPNYLFKQQFKDITSRKKELESVILNFENSISSIHFFEVQKMKSEDLNNSVFDYLNQSYSSPCLDASKEILSPIHISDDNMMIGNKYIAVVTLAEEGNRLSPLMEPVTGKLAGIKIDMPQAIKSKCSMVYPLTLGLPFDHTFNVIIEITENDRVISRVKAENRGLNFIANFYPPAKEKQREQDEFCKAVSQFDYQTSYTSVNVILSDTDKAALDKKIAMTKNGFINMNQAICLVENVETANLFFSSMPGNANTNYRGFVNTTKQAICYLQKENLYLSSAEGNLFSDRFGAPVKVDMWNYPSLVNRNSILIGPSGSGKSFLLNNLILQSIEFQRDVMIIDIGGSYRSLININHGKYYDSNNNLEFSFNPFLCSQDRLGNYIYLNNDDEEGKEDLIKTISSVLSFIWKGNEKITPTEKALLEKSIKAFYEYINIKRKKPNLIEYEKFLSLYEKNLDDYERKKIDFKELKILLEPYTYGELRHLLNAEENIDIESDKLIAFDMEGISKKEYFPIVAILILNLITSKIKRRQGVEKELYIDEALDFLMDEKFGDFIAYLFRTFRKKEGRISIAAQNVLFLKFAPDLIRSSIIINCATKIILDHSEHSSNLKDIQNILSVNDKGIDMIASLQKSPKWRDFFIQMGNDQFVFRNEVSDMASVAFDSRQKTVVALKELVKETGSVVTAINKYLEHKEK